MLSIKVLYFISNIQRENSDKLYDYNNKVHKQYQIQKKRY